MGQYKTKIDTLKAILENQDKILILIGKIVKFVENFKPLIDWVTVLLLIFS